MTRHATAHCRARVSSALASLRVAGMNWPGCVLPWVGGRLHGLHLNRDKCPCANPCCNRRPQLAKGHMQLYSVEQQKSQPLEAHAAAFSMVKVRGHRQQGAGEAQQDGRMTGRDT